MESPDTYFTIDFGVNFASVSRYPEAKLDKIMTDSWNSGVDKVVCICNSIKEFDQIKKLESKYTNLYYTIGIHPHNARLFKSSDIELIKANLSNSKCFGLGECGLDYSRMFSPQDIQLQVFRTQLEIAKSSDSNLYLHCRDAWDDFIKVIKEVGHYKGLVHCWTGTLDQALELTSLGFKLGVTGWIYDTRRNRNLVKCIRDPRIKLEMLVVETDAPFMPIDFNTKESVPSDTGFIVEEIARLKAIDTIECGKSIYKTSIEFLTKK
jgi:TatD DNase family protein